jgi:hypothetical protein
MWNAYMKHFREALASLQSGVPCSTVHGVLNKGMTLCTNTCFSWSKRYAKIIILGVISRTDKDETGLWAYGTADSTVVYVKGKDLKLSLCLTKHHAMKTYWGVEV